MEKLKKVIFFIILVSISTLFSIVVLEGLYRVYRYVKHGHVKFIAMDTGGVFANHDVYGYNLMPDFDTTKLPDNIRFSMEGRGYRLAEDIKVNSRGFRGEEFLTKKGKNVYRILVLGDSTAFCYGDNDKTWPAYLEKLLNEKAEYGSRFEVINGGVPGWRSIECLLKLKNEGIYFQPDLVILHNGWNDLDGSTDSRRENKPYRMYGVKNSPNQIKNIETDVLSSPEPSFIEKHFLLYQQVKNRIIYKYFIEIIPCQ